MAKDRFYRTKPHVNAGALDRLKQLGFSGLGAYQIATGQIITDPHDRQVVAELLCDGTTAGFASTYGRGVYRLFLNDGR
jgi:hypothetical protein